MEFETHIKLYSRKIGKYNMTIEFFRGLGRYDVYLYSLGRYPSLEFHDSGKDLDELLDKVEKRINTPISFLTNGL